MKGTTSTPKTTRSPKEWPDKLCSSKYFTLKFQNEKKSKILREEMHVSYMDRTVIRTA